MTSLTLSKPFEEIPGGKYIIILVDSYGPGVPVVREYTDEAEFRREAEEVLLRKKSKKFLGSVLFIYGRVIGPPDGALVWNWDNQPKP